MSTIQEALRIDHRIGSVPVRPFKDVQGILRLQFESRIAGLVAEVRRRQALRNFDRFADRRLHDIGFERDWDGSVIPTVKG